MFRINTANLVRNKLFICRDWHVQPSEIDKFAFYEYEKILEEIHIVNKEEEKRSKEQEKQMGSSTPNMSSMMNSMKNNMNNFKMPKVSMPKL